MFLTKVLAQLLYPVSLSLWLALLGVVLAWCGYRLGGSCAILTAIAVLWLAAAPVFSDYLRGSLERRYPPTSVEQTPTAEAIVVLSGAIGVVQPPRLTPDLGGAADRVLHAARLYRGGKAPIVIASGGGVAWFGSSTPEARPIADLLHEWNVPRAAIFLETQSLNTYQNAVETKRLLDTRDLDTLLLVTSALHMRRALATFRAAGINAIPGPTDFEVVEPEARTVLDWLPDAGALAGTTRALKEYLGFVVYQLRGWLSTRDAGSLSLRNQGTQPCSYSSRAVQTRRSSRDI